MMNRKDSNSRPSTHGRLFCLAMGLAFVTLLPAAVLAHQTPTSIVLLDVSPGRVGMELQLPLTELELAFGHGTITHPETFITDLGPQLKEYLLAHIHPYLVKDHPWVVEVTSMRMDKGVQEASGPPYWEVVIHLNLLPYAADDTRRFTLDYDVVMHQVMNHAALVSVRNDWAAGHTGTAPAEAGVLHWDMRDNVIYPLQINLQQGSWATGFKSMVSLGIAHIKEGTDHLLFLLVLLLPAMLKTDSRRWGAFAGVRPSLLKLLKIVTAFTLGHSITLLLGALGWVRLPAQPIEVLIAFSILVSAVHALRPLFPGRETYIAGAFGLVHGLAFAATLTNLNLTAGPMALSILGFNLGIELMQLFVIAVTVPWLLMLSRYGSYQYIRIGGALFAAIAAIAWMLQRYLQTDNFLSTAVEGIANYSVWALLLLAVAAVVSRLVKRSKVAAAHNQ